MFAYGPPAGLGEAQQGNRVRIQALIFDMDGLLVDTEALAYGAMESFLAKHTLERRQDIHDQMLGRRENPSPRSWAGQFVSRAVVNTIVPSNRKDLKKRVHYFTAKLDRYFPEPSVEVSDNLSQALKQDWNTLLEEISVVRSRDFADFRRS